MIGAVDKALIDRVARLRLYTVVHVCNMYFVVSMGMGGTAGRFFDPEAAVTEAERLEAIG